MPINTQWWTFAGYMVDMDRDDPGVYELGNENDQVIYIGSSNELRRRLREHLNEPSGTCVKRHAKKYRIEYTWDYKTRERQLYDEHVRVYGRPPICNDVRP